MIWFCKWLFFTFYPFLKFKHKIWNNFIYLYYKVFLFITLHLQSKYIKWLISIVSIVIKPFFFFFHKNIDILFSLIYRAMIYTESSPLIFFCQIKALIFVNLPIITFLFIYRSISKSDCKIYLFYLQWQVDLLFCDQFFIISIFNIDIS